MVGLPFTLRQLDIFELLCKQRSFREVSDYLDISQASVSSQLKALEGQLGVRLFEREPGRKPRLTEKGAAFLADLAPFREAAERLAEHKRAGPAVRQEPPCRIRGIAPLQLLDEYIRPSLGEFLNQHPSYLLNFDSAAAFYGPREAIARNHFDVGLFSERTDSPLGDDFTEITRVVCGVFGPPEFAEGRSTPLSPAELSELPFALPPRGSFYEKESWGLLNEAGIQPARIVARSQYFDVINALSEAGASAAVSLLPLLRPAQREKVTLLYRFPDWRLVLYRNPAAPQPQTDIFARFLVDSVVGDPAYPAFEAAD